METTGVARHKNTTGGGPPEPGRDWGLMGAFQLLGQLEGFLPDREHEFGRSLINNIKLGVQMTPDRFAAFRLRREELNRWCAEIF